jgi:hypothetical protein
MLVKFLNIFMDSFLNYILVERPIVLQVNDVRAKIMYCIGEKAIFFSAFHVFTV